MAILRVLVGDGGNGGDSGDGFADSKALVRVADKADNKVQRSALLTSFSHTT